MISRAKKIKLASNKTVVIALFKPSRDLVGPFEVGRFKRPAKQRNSTADRIARQRRQVVARIATFAVDGSAGGNVGEGAPSKS
jgi:hypothetical protein